MARVKLTPLARGVIRDTGTAAGFALSFFGRGLRLDRAILIMRRGVRLGDRDQQIFQCQFKLLNLALDLLRVRPKRLFLELRDPQPQGLNQLIMGA